MLLKNPLKLNFHLYFMAARKEYLKIILAGESSCLDVLKQTEL